MLRRRAWQTALAGIKAALAPAETGAGSSSSMAAAVAASSSSSRAFGRTALKQQQWGRPTDRIIISPSGGPGRDGYTRFSSQQNPYRRKQQIAMLAMVGTGGTVVWVSSREEIPYSGRKHAILVDIGTERELGAQTFKQVITEAKMTGRLLPQNHRASIAVRRVGSRIAAVASDGMGGGFQSHMKGLNWEFAVIHSPEVNAFVVPGGKVVVYTGLLRLLRTDDELAAVLAHEAGHVLARHVAERLTQGSVVELVRIIAYWAFGLPIPSGPLAAVIFLPNSRKAETEADVIGVQLAARACFDPSAAVDVFSKLGDEEAKHGGNAIPAVLRTHPVSSDRIKRIKEMLPKAEALREASGCSVTEGLFSGFKSRVVSDWGT